MLILEEMMSPKLGEEETDTKNLEGQMDKSWGRYYCLVHTEETEAQFK